MHKFIKSLIASYKLLCLEQNNRLVQIRIPKYKLYKI